MSEIKLSSLMKRSAEKLAPCQHQFFDIDYRRPLNPKVVGACAIGCVLYALNIHGTGAPLEGFDKLPAKLSEQLHQHAFTIADFPADIQKACYWRYPHYWVTIRLIDVIQVVNDYISRDRAIEITEQLGY